MSRWTADQIPDQSGRVAIVTGANSGLGFETTLELARHGAKVVMACRDLDKARSAKARIEERVGGGCDLVVSKLDLADLASVRAFAEEFVEGHDRLHILVNNAGLMATPYRKTKDGLELQLGVNHFGHYALTGLLLDVLLSTEGARVVTVSSEAHIGGRMNWDDLQSEHRYRKWRAYAQSKLANLLFAYELNRKVKAKGVDLVSVAAHPGYSATELQTKGPDMAGAGLRARMFDLFNRVVAQSAAMGALPSLYAATAEGVTGGDYYGPDGIGEVAGFPTKVESSSRSHDRTSARRLWRVSEERTGVVYEPLA